MNINQNEKLRMERKISVGRIVLYQRHGSPNGQHKPEQSPAIVTKVLDEQTQKCQLFVMNPNGVYFDACEFSEELKPGCWSWPVIS